MGFPIGHLFSIRLFLLSGAQTCQVFVNGLMATCKRSKETNSHFIVRFWSAEHFNFKHYSIEREVIWKNRILNFKYCTKRVNRTFSLFTFLLFYLNIWQNQAFSRKLFKLLPDNLFLQGDLKSDLKFCEMSTPQCHSTRKHLSTLYFWYYEIKNPISSKLLIPKVYC